MLLRVAFCRSWLHSDQGDRPPCGSQTWSCCPPLPVAPLLIACGLQARPSRHDLLSRCEDQPWTPTLHACVCECVRACECVCAGLCVHEHVYEYMCICRPVENLRLCVCASSVMCMYVCVLAIGFVHAYVCVCLRALICVRSCMLVYEFMCVCRNG